MNVAAFTLSSTRHRVILTEKMTVFMHYIANEGTIRRALTRKLVLDLDDLIKGLTPVFSSVHFLYFYMLSPLFVFIKEKLIWTLTSSGRFATRILLSLHT
jgi:hypothetical protein